MINLQKLKTLAEQNRLSDLQRLIVDWKLNKVVLASKMPMPTTTFKNKLNPKQTVYSFTESELDRLMEVVKELGADIEIACGKSFSKGIAKIVRKKV